MNIYKIQDAVDGNYAFIIAPTEQDAIQEMSKNTSIPFRIVDHRTLSEIGKCFIVRNDILPF